MNTFDCIIRKVSFTSTNYLHPRKKTLNRNTLANMTTNEIERRAALTLIRHLSFTGLKDIIKNFNVGKNLKYSKIKQSYIQVLFKLVPCGNICRMCKTCTQMLK